MLPPDLERVIEQDHLALQAFMRGDPEPKKALYSRADDATLANPYGPPAVGWNAISDRLEEAAAVLRDGRSIEFQRVSAVASEALAFTVDIERYGAVRIGGSDEAADFDLRVTTVFRRESVGWRIVHRHADSITTARPPDSVLDG
jgi:ketosteroid isomerase-like protein